MPAHTAAAGRTNPADVVDGVQRADREQAVAEDLGPGGQEQQRQEEGDEADQAPGLREALGFDGRPPERHRDGAGAEQQERLGADSDTVQSTPAAAATADMP